MSYAIANSYQQPGFSPYGNSCGLPQGQGQNASSAALAIAININLPGVDDKKGGKAGKHGKNGKAGKHGKNGKAGKNGKKDKFCSPLHNSAMSGVGNANGPCGPCGPRSPKQKLMSLLMELMQTMQPGAAFNGGNPGMGGYMNQFARPGFF
jgi:hypothetical protein